MKLGVVEKRSSPKYRMMFDKAPSYRMTKKKKLFIKKMTIGLFIFIFLIIGVNYLWYII